MSKKDTLQTRGLEYIPGLTQLLSKRPDQFAPGTWPTYYSKAKGTEIWDMDGQHYIDMSISGIGANILGYCDPDVDKAVITAIKNCNSSSLNCPEEIELAELLCELHPWAEKVRYARTGGEAMAVAVRIARAATGRDRIAFCGYHGWHDWYLSANLGDDESLDGHLLPGLSPAGVPKGLKNTAIPFRYNRIDELKNILDQYPSEIAAIVMEPIRNEQPEENFLQEVKQLAKKSGAVLVFDEISSGFRLTCGGAHMTMDVEPDIAVFAKAISNGYPMAAIIGQNHVMSAVEKTFISSTYWTDRIGPVAALATIKKYQENSVEKQLDEVGKEIQKVWDNMAGKHELDIHVYGINPMSHFSFNGDSEQVKMTYFVQEMLKEGFMASNRFYANYAHTLEHVSKFSAAVDKVFSRIANYQNDNDMLAQIEGPVARPGFHRLN